MVENQKNSKLKAIFKFIAIAVVVVGLIVVAKFLGITDYINTILQNTLSWIDGLGIWGPIVFAGIYIIASVALISGAILTLGAGVIFGVVQGSIYVSIASTLAAIVAFIIGRYFLRGWVSKQIESQPKFKAIDKAVAKEGWKIVGLTRLSPIFPFVFLNYAFGVTQVSLKDYAIASWIGMMPGTVMYVYLGSLAGDLATLGAGGSDSNSTITWIIRIVGFIATAAVTVFVTKIARKALDEQLVEKTDSPPQFAKESSKNL
ncbi:TVP38/TMEM64 family protein [Spirulina sp. 06S082]|uniref:TVP38/TMEM64 family protein n=1 Tax=Spirulina sp. 06S082 TaxID=3110248 RepID=UPI002B200F80|nr:TVP38/TMEM64 family protein [Spirulina sp. 06S082]MEA5468357.1 TVP38/TMEM64 family protein [Spirulina sp. 06S082]